MTVADTYAFPAQPQRAREGDKFWAIVDVSLLFLVIMVSSDMLAHIRAGQSLIWLLCYAITLLRAAMLWPYFSAMIIRNKVVLIYPMACLASVLWTAATKTTLVAGVQLTMTMIIATYIGWRYSLVLITKATFYVIFAGVVLSLLHWAIGIFPWPKYSRTGGLIGVYSQKNMLGQRALFGTVIMLSILMMYPWQASVRLKVTVIGALLLTLVAILLSQSMTSVLLVPAMCGLLCILCVKRIPAQISSTLIILSVLGFTLGPVALAISGIDLVQTVLDGVGKDATLTGRTELWEVASHVYAEHPLLGVGYAAFWSAPEFFNERLMTQHAGAVTSSSFHNFVLEILVSAGWPALLGMFALILTGMRRLLTCYAFTGSTAAGCGAILILSIIITSLLGASLYRGHEFMIVVLVMYTVSAGEELRLMRRQSGYTPATDENA